MTTTTYCATHPDVETGLACSRCGTLICPRCLVQTPVGARCKTCARLKRPPMYEVSPLIIARAAGTAIVLGAVMGFLWALLFPGGFFFFFLLILFIGPTIGYFFADMLGRVTNRKRGPVMQGIAVAGLVFAWVVKSVLADGLTATAFQGDLGGLLLLALACAGAITRLR
jgi:hypothetical protein